MNEFDTSLQTLRDKFRWRTKQGELMTIDEMETGHIFNSMKMIFNHLAEAWGGEPVWYVHTYAEHRESSRRDPRSFAFLVVFFITEIERRGDLPEKYWEPYQAILSQLIRKLPPGSSEHLALQNSTTAEISRR